MEEEKYKKSDIKRIQAEQLVSIERVSLNLAQSVIVTTEDKVKTCLDKHFKKAERRKEWVAPLSLLIATIAILVTADFKNFFLSSDTWKAIFIIVAILSSLWLISTIRFIFNNVTIESIINELRADSENNTNENVGEEDL